MTATDQQTARLHEKVRSLLLREVVDVFIGYKQGSNPLRIAPHIVKDAADAEKLVWNLACINNLVPTLHKYAGQKVGIMVKGCDARSLVELLKLNQIQRENVYIIGLACPGMFDAEKVATQRPPASITGISVLGEHVSIFSGAEMVACTRDELLVDKCKSCAQPTPQLYDELLGHATDPVAVDPDTAYADVLALEAQDAAGRLAYWNEQLSKCTLCYACQTVCPMCFCKDCSVTLARNNPKRKKRSRETVFAFHLMRAYHMVGRCTSCYECERVCPVDIPLSTIFKKVEKDCHELFDYTAGSEIDAVPPLSTFGDRDHES